MRQNSIEVVRSNGASQQSEKALKLLAATIRDDTRDIMSVVDLFVNLFGRGPEDVQLALKYVVECLKPLGLRNDHKHKLAEAMSQAASRSQEEINEIIRKAEQLGLMWFTYKKYWKGL